MKKSDKKDKNIDNEIIEKLQLALENETTAKMRAIADLDNFRRRETENRARWSEMAISEFLKNILPNFLELDLLAQNSDDENAKKVVDKFFQDLKKNDVEKISPEPNDEIDENLHEVLLADSVENVAPGRVARTLEAGWRAGNIVLKAAKIAATK